MILIDTHVWVWFHSAPEKLSEPARQRLQEASQVAMSSISIYETMVAIEKGRLASPFDPETLVRRWLAAADIVRVAVSDEIAIRSRSLSFLHADPFDRLIAATAVCENASLMTADQNLAKLDWLATIPAQ